MEVGYDQDPAAREDEGQWTARDKKQKVPWEGGKLTSIGGKRSSAEAWAWPEDLPEVGV
jgi:hypothetical protein